MEDFIIPQGCGVAECTFCKPGQDHYCRKCKTTRSNHFTRNCPHKMFSDDELIKMARDVEQAAIEEKEFIMVEPWHHIRIDSWSQPGNVLFGFSGVHIPLMNTKNFK